MSEESSPQEQSRFDAFRQAAAIGIGACLAVVMLSCSLWSLAARGDDVSSASRSPKRLRFPLSRVSFTQSINSIDADGHTELTAVASRDSYGRFEAALSEGYYLGILGGRDVELPVGGRLVRVQILKIGPGSHVAANFSKAAAGKIKAGEEIVLNRPMESATSDLKQLPDGVLPLEPGNDGSPAARLGQMGTSINNVKQIVLSMHNYHDAHGQFPPAFIEGPDGKPWHSWRVLLLPYLEAKDTFDAYRFDEPWNGPHNIKLLDRMPPVYSDPIYGQNKEHDTHYVAITGDGLAFSEIGGSFGGGGFDPSKPHGGRTIAQFTDGTSRTLLIGPVSPKEKIPWLKPQDIEVGARPRPLGKAGFATPYNIETLGHSGPFCSADGVAYMISERIDPSDFGALLTIAGGENVDPGKLTEMSRAMPVRRITVIHVDKSGQVPKATVQLEGAGFGL
jgi:hypothetical protein